MHTDAQPASIEYLANPFVRGDEIVVPKGTPFTSTDPRYRGDKNLVTGRKQTITVHHTFDSYVDTYHGRGKAYVVPARVTIPGSGGYWKDFHVTEEMLTLNGREIVKRTWTGR